MPQIPCMQTLQRELADSIIRLAPLDELRILLACGAKVNEPVTQGLRPLHYAVYQNYSDAVKLLLVRGSEVDARDEVGYSALHLCAERGFTDCIEQLLEHMAKVDWTDHNEVDQFPRTILADEPLRLAIKNGHYEVAQILLENGANVNAKYFFGTEINLVNVLDVKFLSLLLNYGANPDSCDRSGLTPLMKACRHPDGIQSVLLLLSHGANVNAMTSERHDKRTVLHYAVLSGNIKTVTLLLKQGAHVNFPEDYRKPTPLDFAILRGNVEMVRTLIEAGADVNASSPIIGSPLHVVSADNIDNRLEIMDLLLRSGADPNILVTSENGRALTPPLGEYISSNDVMDTKVIELLLQFGAKSVMTSQFHDHDGILKCIRKLEKSPHIFYRLLDAAESFHLGSIQRSPSLTAFQKDMLATAAINPIPLKHQVRVFLRRLLGPNYPHAIPELEIPPLLKAYLMFIV